MASLILTPEKIDEAIKLYNSGMTYEELSKQFHCQPDTLRKKLREHVPGLRTISGRKNPVKITDQVIEDMQVYRELGLSNKQIAIEMGLSVVTVCRHLGKQKDGHRADYGSIVAHTTGESFVPKGLDFLRAKEASKMEKEKDIVSSEPVIEPISDIIPSEKPMGDLKLKGYSLALEGVVCKYVLSNKTLVIDDRVQIPVEKLTDFLNELYNLQSVVDSRIFEML